MDLLPLEIWNIIFSSLESNHDKFHLLITFRDMFKCSVSFDEMMDLNKIINSQWFNKFTNIFINNNVNELPLNITKLTFRDNFNNEITMKIPSTVTHLAFGTYFQKSVDHCIPSSVIELTFGDYFSRSLENIPSSVVTLNFHIYSVFNKIHVSNPVKIPDFIKTINFIDWDIFNSHDTLSRINNLVYDKKNIKTNHIIIRPQDGHLYYWKKEYVGILLEYIGRLNQ